MLNNYKPFLGKVCTIITNPVSFPFKDPSQYNDFFSGLVTEINEQGIFLKHLRHGTSSFFTFPIMGIVEEKAVLKDDPNYEKIKGEIEKKTPTKPIPVKPVPKNFTSVDDLTKMAKQIKLTQPNNTRQSS